MRRAIGFWGYLCTFFLMSIMLLLIGFILLKGAPTLSLQLFFGESEPLAAMMGLQPVWEGIWPACVGTLTVVLCAVSLASVPGIASGIWLASSPDKPAQKVFSMAVDILAGIPSILMGLFGFSLILLLRASFFPHANASLLLAALCLALLILPYIACATQNALSSLPKQLSVTGAALGMTQWQITYRLVLPQASPGITSGLMLAIGRAAEDTAVIMLTGAVANAGLPGGLLQRFEALPFTIFYYSAQYQSQQELNMAFGAALVLLTLTSIIFVLLAAIVRRGNRNILGSAQSIKKEPIC
ncbi:phosphate ABC transporter permease [Shewanella sp. Choline-02u-19]|uniref:PstA family ABC transporter permease n=1 Tax=unclassified Shewanella TaxID=196818 RepID=UPI000C34E950|nr:MULTISPECIES: ABC transporter permease subunit [unclassified Shewanella]PKH62583.1 phosphate ABC transporter permease [Shewanella sp. Bg11-22]PKI27906.1 phosphate ABC transporter permease [Shewanella sp. Choline-02u-19]